MICSILLLICIHKSQRNYKENRYSNIFSKSDLIQISIFLNSIPNTKEYIREKKNSNENLN